MNLAAADAIAVRYDALRGMELVDGVARLCAMNLFLHGIGPDDDRREPPIKTTMRCGTSRARPWTSC
jgi:hypothetical protein